jgi:NitT/TauT family transport system substrate-binding protein
MARRRIRLLAAMAALALAAAACGDDDGDDGAAATSQPGSGSAAGGGFPAERCTANREAGKVLFLTSFDYAAAASIIDVVVAEEMGWFDAVCLDVELQPGFSSDNVAVVGAGRAQMTSLGSFSEVVVANGKDADLVAVAVEGKTSVEELLVEEGRGVSALRDLAGRTIGIKGAIPFSIRAMLARAGVDEASLSQVEVGFNPAVLFETDIDALPVYKSNEPRQLDAAGYGGKYRAFDPADEEIPASFAVYTTSRSFADDHPTAVADFLRAALRGFEWAEEHSSEAVQLTLGRSDPKLFFSPEGEAFRWATESKLVRGSTPAGQVVGAIDPDRLAAEVDALVELGVIADAVASEAYDGRFVEEVSDAGELVWYE